jgi:glucose-1-phosphate adenylyltransferase
MASPSYDDVLVAVLAGGRGTRLGDLTRECSKPALPFGARYRIVDFVLSNCINSGMHRIGVLTQYHAYSLIQYLTRAWQVRSCESREIEIWPADQRSDPEWYLGTANALYQNLDIIRDKGPRYLLVLAADHVYKMDYRRLIDFHFMRGADMTVACVEYPKSESRHFGVMAVDDTQRIVRFSEKPLEPVGLVNRNGRVLVSMGVYVFNTETLIDALVEDAHRSGSSHDFGHDVIPALIDDPQRLVAAYAFRDAHNTRPAYWRDIGTVDSYWRAHMDLVQPEPEWNMADGAWPLRTSAPALPPARMLSDPNSGEPSVSIKSMVAEGCVLAGALLRDSLVHLDRAGAYVKTELRQFCQELLRGHAKPTRKFGYVHAPDRTIFERKSQLISHWRCGPMRKILVQEVRYFRISIQPIFQLV